MTIKIREDGVAWQQVDDDVIVLDERRSLYMRLAGSAPVLWPMIISGTTVDQLSDALRAHFALTEDTARADARAFVADLRAHELIVDTQ